MVFNTLTVGAAVTPSVIETYFSHYLHRAPLRHKPTAHISYHEGLRLIREFLDYSSKHTVEDIQSFTAQWVPAPHWVRINDAEIAPKFLERAARVLQAQLGARGLELIGGSTWWQWRRPESPLRAEWIEMKKDYHERNRTGASCERAMLYVHGGAYYFGSVDEHRYQMQRHARKLRARVLAPRYRLAPQFPFPCGVYDCLASYFYLLEHFHPSQILVAGDSAGAGMVLSMLVVLRDQGQPLPAGTILLSPWVDLTHSFPSVAGDGKGDYIPSHGFHHRPSMAWPPPVGDDPPISDTRAAVPEDAIELPAADAGPEQDEAQRKFRIDPTDRPSKPTSGLSRFGDALRVNLDGEQVDLKEQIQMYTTNRLLTHPLVSPVMQPSLGGLPPMLIQCGGAELLKDEQLYLAHKAANPALYPPNETIMREFDPQRKALERWPPTDVQLQLWEDLCHVPHTLSFTRPAKYMYRSVAQFAAWALAHAQHHGIRIQQDDAISVISSDGDEDDDGDDDSSTQASTSKAKTQEAKPVSVGKAGDPLPPFKDHMIRQRVTRHGVIYPLAPVSEIAALALDPETIGVPKSGPVRKWLATHQASEQKFASERKKVEKKREKELTLGYDAIDGEHPPPTAIVNRRRGGIAPEEKKKGRSWGLSMWSGWGSNHDEQTLEREKKTEREAVRKASGASALDLGVRNGRLAAPENEERTRRASSVRGRLPVPWQTSKDGERSGTPSASPARILHEQDVEDTGQADEKSADVVASSPVTNRRATRLTNGSLDSPIPVGGDLPSTRQAERSSINAPMAIVPTTSITSPDSEPIPGTDNTFIDASSSRPHNGVQAYPFKLKDHGARTASTMTLDSLAPTAAAGIPETSAAHSDLVGGINGPVELPSGPDMLAYDGEETIPTRGRSEPGTGTSAFNVQQARSDALETLTAAPSQSNVKPPTRAEGVGISPVDSAAPSVEQTAPFRIRNPVFDNRTSMLGSLGADGMPIAHHTFTRDDSPQRQPPSEDVPSVPRVPAADGAKAAPFKMRHTLYEPDVTLGTTQFTDHSNVPEHAAVLGKGIDRQVLNGREQRESGALGNQLGEQRIVGEQRDLPSREENDRPPPPPPKDDSYVPAVPKVTGLRNPMDDGHIDGDVPPEEVGKAVTTGPLVIGDLAFEADENALRLDPFDGARADHAG